MNLSHFLRSAGRRLKDEVGLVWGESSWNWSELDARVDAMASALVRGGLKKGDRVIVQSKNSNQMFETMFACWRAGCVWVPTNFRQTPAEVAYLAGASGASGMFCQIEFSEHAAAIRAAAQIRFSVTMGGEHLGDDYEALIERFLGTPMRAIDVDHDDPCWFFFTSGTTGRPKAAVLTHGQMGFVATSHLVDLMPAMQPETDASLVVAPLSHGAGVHQLAQVARGVKTVLLPTDRLDAALVWREVEKWRITNMFTVPTILKILVEDPSVDISDHSSLKYVIYAGAPMYREDQKRAMTKLGRTLVQYYGLGEVTGSVTVLPPRLHEEEDAALRVGSCGHERTAMEISIQDDEGVELDAHQTGEICVRGLAVFAGYHNDPEANAKAFRNGWFRTGDIGHQDDGGFLYITGRASDMYISGGSNVYPREIEEAILTRTAVAEAAVFGVPDPRWGEVGVAAVVVKPDQVCTEEDLIAMLGERVARYKIPKRIVFLPELPKSGYGKVQKNVLRALLHEPGSDA